MRFKQTKKQKPNPLDLNVKDPTWRKVKGKAHQEAVCVEQQQEEPDAAWPQGLYSRAQVGVASRFLQFSGIPF